MQFMPLRMLAGRSNDRPIDLHETIEWLPNRGEKAVVFGAAGFFPAPVFSLFELAATVTERPLDLQLCQMW